MTLLAAIAQMNDGIAIDQFLYEIMVIWSAVHELEIDLLIQVYELVAGSQSGKIPYSVFVSVLQDLFNCPDEVCIPFTKSASPNTTNIYTEHGIYVFLMI